MPETKTSKTPTFQYVGPHYKIGLMLPGYPKPLKLKDFTKQQAQEFVKKHKEYARFWTGL